MDEIRKLTEDDIFNLAQEYAPGLEPLVMAISKLEGGHGKAGYGVNSDGVTSPMQIMSKELGGKYPVFETYAAPGKTDPRNPEHGTIAGIRLLAELHKNHYDKHGIGGVASAYFSGKPDTSGSVSDKNGTSVEKYKQLVEQNYQQGIRKYGELGKEGSDSWVRNQIRADIKQAQDSGTPLSLAQLRTAQAFQVPVPNATDELARQYTTAREANQAPSNEALDIIKSNQLNPDQLPSWPIPASGSGDEATVAGEVQVPSESSTGKQVKPDYAAKADLALGSANVDNASVRAGATAALRRFTDLQEEVAKRRTADEFLMSKAGFDMDREKNGWFGATMRNLGMWGVDEDIRRPKEDRDLRQLGELAGITAKTGKDVTDINYAGVRPAVELAQVAGKEEDRQLKVAQATMAQEEAKSRIAERELRMEAKKAEMEATAKTEEALNQGYEVLGIAPEDRAGAQQFLRSNPKIAAQILAVGASKKIGDTLSDSVEFAKILAFPMGEGKRAMIQSLAKPLESALFSDPKNKAAAELLKKSKVNPKPMLPEEEAAKKEFLKGAMNMAYSSMARGEVPDWVAQSSTPLVNPYVASPSDLSTAINTLNSFNAGKAKAGKALPTYTPATSPEDYIEKSLNSGKKTVPEVARDFQLFAEARFDIKGYSSIGLDNPAGFFVKSPVGGAHGKLLNLANPAELASYYTMTKQIKEAQALNAGKKPAEQPSSLFDSLWNKMSKAFD